MKYKLIACDFDDTILKDDLTYTDVFKKAVQDYVAAGGKFIIATGRMTEAVMDAAIDLDLKGELISYQGAVTTDIQSNKTISKIPIPLDTALTVLRFLEERGIYFQLYEDNAVVARVATDYSKAYARYCKCKIKETGIPVSEYIEKVGDDPVKVLIMDKPEKVDDIILTLTEKFGDKILANTSKPGFVEIISKNTNKGIAIKNIIGKYNIVREEVMAIGDSLNDLSMIEFAGLGVAVGNAQDVLKKAADVIVPSNENEGVAYAIRKFGLGENI